MDDNFIEVNIDNKAYHLSCEGNREHLRNVAEYIETKIKNISLAAPSIPKNNNIFTIYVAANIADELLKERELRDILVNEKFNESIAKFQKNNPEPSESENTDIVKLIDENDSLNKKTASLSEALEELKLELTAKDADLNTIKETNESIISQRDTYKEKLSISESEIEKHKEEITAYRNENAFLKEQIKKSEAYVSQYPVLSEKVQELSEKNSELETKLSESKQLSEKLSDENNAFERNISELQSKAENYKANISELNSSLDTYINENKALKEQLLEAESSKAQNNEFKDIISEYGETINTLNEKIKQIKSENEMLRNSADVKASEAASTSQAEIENQKLREQLDFKAKENDDIKRRLSETKTDLNIAKSRLGNLQVELNKIKGTQNNKLDSKNKQKR